MDERAVCGSCLAVHHVGCWKEHGRCSACASEQGLLPGSPRGVEPAPTRSLATPKGEPSEKVVHVQAPRSRLAALPFVLGAAAGVTIGVLGWPAEGALLLAVAAFALFLFAMSAPPGVTPAPAPVASRAQAAFDVAQQEATSPKTTSELIEQLSSAAPEERAGAAVALGYMSPRADEALPALTRVLEMPPGPRSGPRPPQGFPRHCGIAWELRHDDRGARGAAAWAIGQIGQRGSRARGAIATLTLALGDADPGVRFNAAEALAIIGPESPKPLDALIALMAGDAFWRVRHRACDALGGYWGDEDRVVPALTRALGDEAPPVRARAAEQLQGYAEAARSVVPALIAAYRASLDESRDGEWQRGPFDGLGAPSTFDSPGARLRIVRALGVLDGAHPDVVELLREAARDRDTEVATAARALLPHDLVR